MGKRNTRLAARGTAVSIAEPVPWVAVLGGGAVGLASVGVLAYASSNTGVYAPNPMRDTVLVINWGTVAATAPSQGHKAGPLTYDHTPSSGGEHHGLSSTGTGAGYRERVSAENATHSMEHGAVRGTYRPDHWARGRCAARAGRRRRLPAPAPLPRAEERHQRAGLGPRVERRQRDRPAHRDLRQRPADA